MMQYDQPIGAEQRPWEQFIDEPAGGSVEFCELSDIAEECRRLDGVVPRYSSGLQDDRDILLCLVGLRQNASINGFIRRKVVPYLVGDVDGVVLDASLQEG